MVEKNIVPKESASAEEGVSHTHANHKQVLTFKLPEVGARLLWRDSSKSSKVIVQVKQLTSQDSFPIFILCSLEV